MIDWEYEELMQTVEEIYENFLGRNMSNRLALARTFSEFETVGNDGELETIIVNVVIGQIVSSHEKISIGHLNYIRKIFAGFEASKFADKLSNEELQDLSARINNVLETIKKMPVEYNPRIES